MANRKRKKKRSNMGAWLFLAVVALLVLLVVILMIIMLGRGNTQDKSTQPDPVVQATQAPLQADLLPEGTEQAVAETPYAQDAASQEASAGESMQETQPETAAQPDAVLPETEGEQLSASETGDLLPAETAETQVFAEPEAEAMETQAAEPADDGLQLASDGGVLPGRSEIGEVAPEAGRGQSELRISFKVYVDGQQVTDYQRENPISFGTSEEFTQVEGITTFRGNNYRDSAAYGNIPENPSQLTGMWYYEIGRIDSWTGVGWTGQCAIIRWPEETRRIMNIYPEKKEKQGLTEVIYATLDGNIYFLDMEDGQPTRDPISIGQTIKGSLTIDPRGYPLLYVGQGICTKGKPVGTRIFSLIDQSMLYFLDGRDELAPRDWYAFDCSPLIDPNTDTMIQSGENGVFYVVKLNTDFDAANGTISIDPEVERYVYASNKTDREGIENSIAVYNHYAYLIDNSGFLHCLDLNTFMPQWVADTKDDVDATIVLEEEEPGHVALYTGCELDLRGHSGNVYLRKYDALTGHELWCVNVRCTASDEDNGGLFATPAVGKENLSGLVYFHVARTRDGGTLFAIDKATGEIRWQRDLNKFGWSSPVCVYTPSGEGYVLVGSSNGILRMLDGLTGEQVDSIDLDYNIEGSPCVFEDMIVVGTRDEKIMGVRIE